MSSEIEIVDKVQESRDRDAATENGNGTVKGRVNEKILKDDVFTASAYGNLKTLRRLVESEGCSVSQPDSDGFYPLQWAALNNRVAAAQYIIQHGGDVNARDVNGQTALHWSAVRGAMQVAEFLLQEGAQINAADKHGYQTTHFAAQNGQTAFLYHIVTKWNADPDVPDNDGRRPLHWAAYKGYTDCLCLLLFLDYNSSVFRNDQAGSGRHMDSYTGCQDIDGCTPLHWAAIRGNLQACKLLVQAGKKEDLMVTDNTGFTPQQLASDRNYQKITLFLRDARRELDKGRLSKLGLAPALFSVIFVLILTYINSVIMASNLPKMTAGSASIAWIGILLACAGLVLLCRCTCKDPGYVKTNRHDSQNMKDAEPLLKVEINDPALVAGNWSQLCVACQIVRPVHATHCPKCNRCVEQFHHHCPLLSTCIAKRNKRDLMGFLVLEILAILITGPVAITRIVTDPSAPSSLWAWLKHAGSQHIGALLFVISDGFLLMVVSSICGLSSWFSSLCEWSCRITLCHK